MNIIVVCSFGALKLCERHPVNGYTFCLASYYAIGTYSVLGANRAWVASRASGASPELLEIISVVSSPISPSRLSARSYLRYLFVLATVHYDVLSDGQYRLDVSKAVAGVG
jgi:hypothetical protein